MLFSSDSSDLCWQSDVSLLICCLGLSWLSSKEQVSFNFTTLVIVHNDLEFKKIKIITVSDFSPSICHEVMGLDAMILVF